MSFPTLHELSQTLAWTLLHFLWQGLLVGALYAIGKKLSESIRWQHALAVAALVLLLALPMVTFYALSTAAVSIETTATATSIAHVPDGIAAVDRQTVVASDASLWSQALVAVWLLGAFFISIRLLSDWRLVRKAIRESLEPPKELLAMLERQMRRMGLIRKVRLRLTARITTPGVYGLLRPVVLLPVALALSLPKDQLETLLIHELAHIRRADFIANMLALCARTLLYFHPVVHWVCRDLERTRETLCDDLVIDFKVDPIKYARALSKAEEFRQQVPVPLLTATGGELTTRVHRILSLDTRKPRKSNDRAPLLLAMGAITASLAGLSGVTQEQLLAATRPDFRAAYSALMASQAPTIAQPELDLATARLDLVAPALTWTVADEHPISDSSSTTAPVINRSVEASSIAAPEAALPSSVDDPPGLFAVNDTGTGNVGADSIAGISEPAGLRAKAEAEAEMAESAVPNERTAAPSSEVSRSPRTTQRVQPTYPRSARWQGIEGSVTLKYRIDAKGRPSDIEVVAATPAGVFEKTTLDAFKRWQFEAPNVTGSTHLKIFDFNLGNTQSENCEIKLGSKICRR